MSYTPLLGHWYSVVCPLCYNDVVFECRTLYSDTIICNACHSCIDLCKVVETEHKTNYDVCTDGLTAPVKYSNEVVNVGRNPAAEITLNTDNSKHVNNRRTNSTGNGINEISDRNEHSRESAMTDANNVKISPNDNMDDEYCVNIDSTSQQQHYNHHTKSKNGATCSAGGSAAIQLATIMNDVDREVAQVLPERVSEEVRHTFLAQRQRSIMDFFNFLSFITHTLERVIFIDKPVLVIGHVRIYRKRFVCSSLWSKVLGKTNNFNHEESGNGISHRVSVQSNISNNSHQNSSNKKFDANDEVNNLNNDSRNHTRWYMRWIEPLRCWCRCHAVHLWPFTANKYRTVATPSEYVSAPQSTIAYAAPCLYTLLNYMGLCYLWTHYSHQSREWNVIMTLESVLVMLFYYLLFTIAYGDPGYIWPTEVESSTGGPSHVLLQRSLHDISVNHRESIYELRNGERVERRWCATCCHYRPVRAAHCYRCGLCVTDHDHHCPLIGVCVGRRNLEKFVLFVFVSAWGCLAPSSLLVYSWFVFRKEISTLDMAKGVILLIPLIFFACYHSAVALSMWYNLVTEQTTRERLRGAFVKKRNPYTRGWICNVWYHIWGKSTGPSWFMSAVIDYIEKNINNNISRKKIDSTTCHERVDVKTNAENYTTTYHETHVDKHNQQFVEKQTNKSVLKHFESH